MTDQTGISGFSVLTVENLNGTSMPATTNASLDDIAGDQVFLFGFILDETGSMSDHRQTVIEAYNRLIAKLKRSKSADEILMSTWLFSTDSHALHGYLPIAAVEPLDQSKYSPHGQTALFDTIGKALEDPFSGVVSYAKSLQDNGIRVKVCLVVYTDGGDNASRSYNSSSIKVLVDQLVTTEQYLFTLVSFGGGMAKDIAHSMGFRNLLEAGSTDADIDRATDTVSNSVIRASQTTINPQTPNGFF